jgi:hypothetical protein
MKTSFDKTLSISRGKGPVIGRSSDRRDGGVFQGAASSSSGAMRTPTIRPAASAAPTIASIWVRLSLQTPATNDSVLGQLRTAFSSHPLAFLTAIPFGGFVPVATWTLTHTDPLLSWEWVLVAGGAVFSSLTVIEWGQRVLRHTIKTVGFAILVEGTSKGQ